MKRGVKRQAAAVETAKVAVDVTEDSPEKKKRIETNAVFLDKMKKEAEEKKREVLNKYLESQKSSKAEAEKSRRETIAVVTSNRTPGNKTEGISDLFIIVRISHLHSSPYSENRCRKRQ